MNRGLEWTHLYVLARLLPLIWAVATLARAWVPKPIALSLLLALTHAAVPIAGELPAPSSRPQLAVGLLRELSVGGVYALALTLALASVPWTVRLAQPQGSRAPVAPLAQLYGLCAAWLVLSLGGARAALRALLESFRVVPLAGADASDREFLLGVAQLVANALSGALMLALPFAIAAVLLELGAGLLVRATAGGPRDGLTVLVGPVLFLLLAAAMLVPLIVRSPDLVRAALELAAALTRTLVK